MNQSAVSLAVGMNRGTSSQLEGGRRIPRIDTVEKLAKVLNVSPCLLAYGSDQLCESGDGSLSAGLPARLSTLRQERGLSRLELGRLSATSHTFVRMTETGSTVPSIGKVEQLAKALNVSACWLSFGVGPKEVPDRRRSAPAAPTSSPGVEDAGHI